MRFVIFGAGAIGGVVGLRLHQSGHSVMLIARGANHDAIARDGLRLMTPIEDLTLRVPVAASAAEAGLSPDDVILLCVKSQDTRGALQAIRDALPASGERAARRRAGVPIVCLQNGVENEREALRVFPDVYGAVVMMPAEHLEPGLVISYGAKLAGQIYIGRFPEGVDDRTHEICAALSASQIDSQPRDDVMTYKYAKLITNLVNSIEAVCGRVDPDGNAELRELAFDEGRQLLTAAGIEFEATEVADLFQRWSEIGVGEVDGHSHRGGSTWQSIARGQGSVETDYLTGELVLIARRLGIVAPVNEALQDLTALTLSEGHEPGWVKPRELIAELAARSARATSR